MEFTVCSDITEWIEEEITRPVEEWVERQEQRCREEECIWWMACLNKLFCWLVTILVKVVIWVVDIVGRWVVRTVCKIVVIVFDLIVKVVSGLINILGGIFTWDWGRVWDGFVEIADGFVGAFGSLVRILFLGDTIEFIREEVNKGILRNHVRRLLESKYSGRELDAIKDALSLDHGAFGLRIRGRAARTFVRSDTISNQEGVPDLILMHENSASGVNLKVLAGYEDRGFWQRFRPEVVAEDGNSFSEKDLNRYINQRGKDSRKFSIFCMSEGTLSTKLQVAMTQGRKLGLILKWDVEDMQVTEPHFIIHPDTDENLALFLRQKMGRRHDDRDEAGARDDLCVIAAGAVFGYAGKLNGISAHIVDTPCLDGSNFDGQGISGVTFKDRLPDFVWKYVLIHEIGHYFGLCHADGLERIMFTANEVEDKSYLTWTTFLEYIYLSGGPTFTLDEAKSVWSFIIANFPASCLSRRHH